MASLLSLAAGIGLILLAVSISLQPRKKRAALRARMRAEWGAPKVIDRDHPLIASYHNALSRSALDNRTWEDLDLDAVFDHLDRTESVVGRQVLYHRLRSTEHSPDTLARFDDLVEMVRHDEITRLDIRLLLRVLRESTSWLWSLALEPVERLPRWAAIYPLFALTMVASIVLGFVFRGPLLLVPLLGVLVGGALRGAFGSRLVPLREPFRDLVRLLSVAERLGRLAHLPSDMQQRLTERLPRLRRLRQAGGWLGRAQEVASGDLMGVVVEYFNMVFCLDVNAAMMGVRELRRHQDDVHHVFQAVGELDSAVAVASLRDGGGRTGRGEWTRPVFADEAAPAVFDDLRHPLIENAVPNSVTLGPPAGMLVTGANMTGKSTFLRTIGVNVVLAETINTVFAASYEAPWLHVASCITPRDDLQAGKSYYQAEVETLVAMLAMPNGASGETAAAAAGTRLYLFDELFRGTNTLDRIGAASAVLSWLIKRAPDSALPRCIVIAATHDLELVALLPDCAFVHFGDRLTPDGLQFDYKLRPGPTTTRNAIALLGVLGAPPEVVSEALARSDRLRAKV